MSISATDFLRLPSLVRIVVVLLLWPAIWAGGLMVVTLAGDLVRQEKTRTPPTRREVA